MLDLDDLIEINNIFIRISNDKNLTLKRGSVLRTRMWDEIKAGNKPNSYRYDWVKTSSTAVLKNLGTIAKDFNNRYLDDTASVDDLRDILTMALDTLNKKR